MKKVLTTLCLILALCTTSVHADYVDSSNRAHADGQNDIIQAALVQNSNNVVIYLTNESGIDYDFGSKISSYSIPFVTVKSVKLAKSKLDDKGTTEVSSDYYNKITLKVSASVHEKQRFIIINNFIDGTGEPASKDTLMFSIAPRGEKRIKINQANSNKTTKDNVESKNNESEHSQTKKEDKTSDENDTMPLIISSASFKSATTLEICFNRPVDQNSASDKNNYKLSNIEIQSIGVMDAGKKVILSFDYEHQKSKAFTLMVSNLSVDGKPIDSAIIKTVYNSEIIKDLMSKQTY